MMSDDELEEDSSSVSCFPEIKGIVTRWMTHLTSGTSTRAGAGIVRTPVSLPRLTCLEKPYDLEEHTES